MTKDKYLERIEYIINKNIKEEYTFDDINLIYTATKEIELIVKKSYEKITTKDFDKILSNLQLEEGTFDNINEFNILNIKWDDFTNHIDILELEKTKSKIIIDNMKEKITFNLKDMIIISYNVDRVETIESILLFITFLRDNKHNKYIKMMNEINKSVSFNDEVDFCINEILVKYYNRYSINNKLIVNNKDIEKDLYTNRENYASFAFWDFNKHQIKIIYKNILIENNYSTENFEIIRDIVELNERANRFENDITSTEHSEEEYESSELWNEFKLPSIFHKNIDYINEFNSQKLNLNKFQINVLNNILETKTEIHEFTK